MMDSNFSIYTTYLTMESLEIPPYNIVTAFVFGTLTYCSILFLNITVSLTIALNRKLYKPMYLLLLNLPVNDMMIATAFFPQLVYSILSQNRTITYSACFVQALFLHFSGTASSLILTAMAYDRYIAICRPLKYNTLMSPNNVLKIIIFLWALNFILIGVLFALNYREEICSTIIVDLFCNNPSLIKLRCGDTKVNNYYGLIYTIIFHSLKLLAMLFTYIQILITVFWRRQTEAKSKAIQTCSTHLIVYLCFEISALFAIFAHRFEAASPNLRRAFGASVMIFPPIINPLVYGLKTKEIHQNLILFPHKKISPTKQKTKHNKKH